MLTYSQTNRASTVGAKRLKGQGAAEGHCLASSCRPCQVEWKQHAVHSLCYLSLWDCCAHVLLCCGSWCLANLQEAGVKQAVCRRACCCCKDKQC
jgi:hypothetical protein